MSWLGALLRRWIVPLDEAISTPINEPPELDDTQKALLEKCANYYSNNDDAWAEVNFKTFEKLYRGQPISLFEVTRMISIDGLSRWLRCTQDLVDGVAVTR
jgi:hypothetical protein